MEIVTDNTIAGPATSAQHGVRQMTRFEQWRFGVARWLLWQRRRFIPHLVWWGDELDVVITFSQDRLRDGQSTDAALAQLFSGGLYEIEKQFRGLEIGFDTGCGFDGRDWEWDWSLNGPVSVRFKARATKPHLRKARPKPTLVPASEPPLPAPPRDAGTTETSA